jgi:hypothetical protein
MWPFKSKKSEADVAVEWMPRAIEVAAEKWLEFESQPFAQDMDLEQKLFAFSEGLKQGLRRWQAFKAGPDAIFLLIAAKGVEQSETHLRVQIEAALKLPLPGPHVRTDEEESRELTNRVIDRAKRKWMYFSESLPLKSDVPLERRIDAFRMPFLEGLRLDYPMFREVSDDFFDPMIALGIERSGSHSLSELERVLKLRSIAR